MNILQNAYEYISPGGLIMIPLIFLSVWMWFLVFMKMFFFRQLKKNDLNLKEAKDMIRGKDRVELKDGLFASIVSRYLLQKTGDRITDKRILDQCSMAERPKIRDHLAVIESLAGAAPLFGLLGTVTGMIQTFEVLSFFGTGNARAIAGGIKEALLTTQSGLMVAIPGLLISVYLNRKANRIENELEEFVMALKRHIK